MTSILVDGITLSSLLYKHQFSKGNQYGLLFGQHMEHEENEISDSAPQNSNTKRFTYISSFVPAPNHKCLHSRAGHIDEKILNEIVSKQEQTLVGWYSFRLVGSSRPSLREVTFHQSLRAQKSSPENLLFFLSTTSPSRNGSTISIQHSFMFYNEISFTTVPLEIQNLGNTAHSQYSKHGNAGLAGCQSLQNVFQKSRKHFVNDSGTDAQVTKIKALEKSINSSIQSCHDKVLESESTLSLLDSEVKILRQRYQRLEQEEILRVHKWQKEKKQQREQELLAEKEEAMRAEEEKDREELEKWLLDLDVSVNEQNSDSKHELKREMPSNESNFAELTAYPSNSSDSEASSESFANCNGTTLKFAEHKPISNGLEDEKLSSNSNRFFKQSKTSSRAEANGDSFDFVSDLVSAQLQTASPKSSKHMTCDLNGSEEQTVRSSSPSF